MSLTNQNHLSPREIKKHKKALHRHLREFFELLDSRPQPSNEKVRAEFVRHEAEWRLYCTQNCLSARVAELFNANVSLEWEKKYVRPTQQ